MFPQCRKMRDLAGAGTFPLLFQRRIKHLVKGSAAGERDEELRGLNHAPYRKRGMMDVESLPPHPVGRRTLFFFLTAGRDRPLNCPAFTGAKAGTRRSGGCRHGPLDDGLPQGWSSGMTEMFLRCLPEISERSIRMSLWTVWWNFPRNR